MPNRDDMNRSQQNSGFHKKPVSNVEGIPYNLGNVGQFRFDFDPLVTPTHHGISWEVEVGRRRMIVLRLVRCEFASSTVLSDLIRAS